MFRVQFLALGEGSAVWVAQESILVADSAVSAIDHVINSIWPPEAIAFRLVDGHGREVFPARG